MSRSRPTLRWPWHAALACFIVAGSTGALLRFALLNGSPWSLSLQNIRHAHSHLMYSGSLPPAVRALAGFSAVLAAIGLLSLLAAFARTHSDILEEGQSWLWRISLFFLSLKALAFLVVSTASGASWSLRMGKRISYLHWLLLGGITIGLLAAAHYHWGHGPPDTGVRFRLAS